MSLLFQTDFPLHQLKKLHHDLTELENYIQIMAGDRELIKESIFDIYQVQELIEDIVNEEKRLEREEEKKSEINNLNLDF